MNNPVESQTLFMQHTKAVFGTEGSEIVGVGRFRGSWLVKKQDPERGAIVRTGDCQV
jgi:hypothetical protein